MTGTKIYRNGFSMITAIMLLIVLSTVASFVVSFNSKAAKSTASNYIETQAKLLAKSYTELAILSATATNCTQHIDADALANNAQIKKGAGFEAHVDINYIGSNSGCSNSIGGTVENIASRGAIILIDVYIQHYAPNGNADFNYHKRTLQRL